MSPLMRGRVYDGRLHANNRPPPHTMQCTAFPEPPTRSVPRPFRPTPLRPPRPGCPPTLSTVIVDVLVIALAVIVDVLVLVLVLAT